jgi:hypothetical protein
VVLGLKLMASHLLGRQALCPWDTPSRKSNGFLSQDQTSVLTMRGCRWGFCNIVLNPNLDDDWMVCNTSLKLFVHVSMCMLSFDKNLSKKPF